jgi:hypothetical protein
VRASPFAFIAPALLCSAAVARADDAVPQHPALQDTVYFSVGMFHPKTSTSTQLDSTTHGVGTNIDFERALGMQTQEGVPDFFLRWRVTDRWRFDAGYFELNRSGDKVIDREINWGDQTYSVGAEVKSKFDFSDLRIAGAYSLFKRPDKDVGIGFGFHVASYDAALSLAGLGAASGIGGSSEAKKVTAPLPVLTGYGQFALTDRWAISVRVDRFALSYNDNSGNITSSAIDVQYQPFRHVGFGFAYRSLFIDLTATRTTTTATFNQTFQGPLLYVSASF